MAIPDARTFSGTVVALLVLTVPSLPAGGQLPPPFPGAAPCDDHGIAATEDICGACDAVSICPFGQGCGDPESPFHVGVSGDGALYEQLSCDTQLCEDLLATEQHPVAERCKGVYVDQRDIPNLVVIVADDWNWAMSPDVESQACVGGDHPGVACATDADCSPCGRCVTGKLSLWREYYQDGFCFPSNTPVSCDNPACAPAPNEPEPYCGSPIQTPALDALAERGAYFPVAHTPGGVCKPVITAILAGHYGKDIFSNNPVRNRTSLPDLVRNTHCSISIGKTWSTFDFNDHDAYHCCDCCQELDPGNPDARQQCLDGTSTCTRDTCCGDKRAGFRYSVEDDFGISYEVIGRKKNSLEAGACMLREVNRQGLAFFAWLVPHLPHDPSGAPAGFDACYETVGDQSVTKMDGTTDNLPDEDYLGRVSWLDCSVASFLDFLEQTPDTRFCDVDLDDQYDPARHDCGPCTRNCDPQAAPGDCVPCLIDTTAIMYINDNGNRLENSKNTFGENGYHNQIIFAYGDSGRTGLRAFLEGVGLPPAIRPRIHNDKLANGIDFAATLVDYANASPECVELDRCPSHEGQSLKRAAEGQGPWREYLFGHKNSDHNDINGKKPHYVRTRRMIAETLDANTGSGICNSDIDCVEQGWAVRGLDTCFNGVCTKTCTLDEAASNECKACAAPAPEGSECRVKGEDGCQINLCGTGLLGGDGSVYAARKLPCVWGHCAVASECKLKHFDGYERMYNLATDPDEKKNLTNSQANRYAMDPLNACYKGDYGETLATAGEAHYRKLTCELVRWCLEGCDLDGTIDCGYCGVSDTDRCKDVECVQVPPPPPNAPGCKDLGTCFEVENEYWDCRRPCDNDPDCADLGVSCDQQAGKCTTPVCQSGDCADPTTTTTTTLAPTTTTTLACGANPVACNDGCDCGACSWDADANQCVCVEEAEDPDETVIGCNIALAAQGDPVVTPPYAEVCSAYGTCPEGMECQRIWFTCGCRATP